MPIFNPGCGTFWGWCDDQSDKDNTDDDYDTARRRKKYSWARYLAKGWHTVR